MAQPRLRVGKRGLPLTIAHTWCAWQPVAPEALGDLRARYSQVDSQGIGCKSASLVFAGASDAGLPTAEDPGG